MTATVSSRVGDLHARFCSALTHRYFVRAHMAVMLALVLASGLIADRALVRSGLTSMTLRYPAAVLASYLVFFLLIRLWLAYVCRVYGRGSGRAAGSRANSASDGGFLDGTFGWSGGSGAPGGGSAGNLVEGGGEFGGGGSSGSFSDGPVPILRAFKPSGSGSGGGSSGGGGDGDGLLLLLLFALVVAAIFGAGAYVIYEAPAILPNAAFHVVLAGGLAKTARDVHDPGWFGGILRATVIPFALVLVVAGAFGYEAHLHCPGALTAAQVFRNCIF